MQVCHEWNTAAHVQEASSRPRKRPLTRDELQDLFDYADDRVDHAHRHGRKGWISAFRVATAIKVAYAWGLRRNEVRMLELTDFGTNPHAPAFGGYGVLYVRHGKAMRGSPPKRRSVLLLGAFLILGLNPGPEMLGEHLEVTLSLVWIIVLSTIAAVILGFLLIRPLAKLTSVTGRTLVPFLIAMLTIGAFSNTSSLDDVWIMLVFLAIGVLCSRFKWPRIPLLLGLVLGEILERYFTVSYALFQFNWVGRPGVILIELIIAGTILLTAVRIARKKRAAKRELVTTGGLV